jgi:hypothetical protein
MIYQTEAKAQGWRAVAVFDDRPDRLLYIGLSCQQVRGGLVEAFRDGLDDEERDHVTTISMQRWHGAPDSGRWLHHSNLNLPELALLSNVA